MGIWETFCDELKRAGSIVDRPATPDHEIDRAEGYRYLTRLLRVGLDLTLEFADPAAPVLMPAQARHFGDGGNTADCLYLHAVVDGGRRYRIRGTRGSAPLIEVGLYAGKIGLDPVSRRVDALLEDQLVVDQDGCIDIGVGTVDGCANTMHSEPSANYVFVRQYSPDWRQTIPAELVIEPVDDQAPYPAPLTLAALETGLQRAARFVGDAATAWAALVDGTRMSPANVFYPVSDDVDMTLPTGHRFPADYHQRRAAFVGRCRLTEWFGLRHSSGGRLRARPGATRSGSSGILGYTGGQGASERPLARSRAYMSSRGCSDCGLGFMSAQGSPLAASNDGTLAMVSALGSTSSMSAQRIGVETWPPTRERTDHAPKTVLWGAFWLKSMNTREPRSSFHHAAVIRSGRRRSSSRATATAACRTA